MNYVKFLQNKERKKKDEPNQLDGLKINSPGATFLTKGD